MADKTISLELTEQEGWLLWHLVAAERQKVEQLGATPDIHKLCKSIHDKIKTAIEAAKIESGVRKTRGV